MLLLLGVVGTAFLVVTGLVLVVKAGAAWRQRIVLRSVAYNNYRTIQG